MTMYLNRANMEDRDYKFVLSGRNQSPLRATGIADGNIYGKIREERSFRKMNPKQGGKPMACWNCGAITHLAKNCPEKNFALVVDKEEDSRYLETHRIEKDETEDLVNKFSGALAKLEDTDVGYVTYDILVTEEVFINTKQSFGGPGSQHKAILDTGCASTVTGKAWMNNFIKEKLSERARKIIKVTPSKKIFKFGGGERRPSLGHYSIPVSVQGHNMLIQTDVCEAPLPMLISKTAMKKAGVVINTKLDTMEMFGKTFQLEEIEALHYAISFDNFVFKEEVKEISDTESDMSKEDYQVLYTQDHNILVELPDSDKDKKEDFMKKIKKMHEQLGHPSIKVFLQMLKTTGIIPNGDISVTCDKDESGRCLSDQSGTSYFHYCPRLVWEGLARLVWQLIFSLLPQTSLGSACQTNLAAHIFTNAPD